MNLITFTVFTLFCFCFVTQTVAVSYLNEYKESLKAWKALNAYNYSFRMYVDSFPEGCLLSKETTFTVVNNRVVKREYSVTIQADLGAGGCGPLEVVESWVESSPKALGSHKDGYRPFRTLDQLYTYCRNEILTQDPDKYWIYFITNDDNGILRECSYQSKSEGGPGVGFSFDNLVINS